MTKLKYYSQNGEDYLLWQFFEGKRNGFFVDIGAFDGVHLSNTFAFEQMGWRGICIEPNPEIYEFCKRNRARSVCLNVACIGERKQRKVKFFVDEMGLLSSTANDKEKMDEIERRYRNRSLEFSGLREIEVSATTLSEILDQHAPRDGKIDFISIDTEGNEPDIIRATDLNKYDIRVMVIEMEDRDENEIAALLQEGGGYRLARRTTHNAIFTRTHHDSKKIQDISINCVIEKQVHPKGDQFVTPIFRNGKVIRNGKIVKGSFL